MRQERLSTVHGSSYQLAHQLDEKGVAIIIIPILQIVTLSHGKEAGRWQNQDVNLWHLSDPCTFQLLSRLWSIYRHWGVMKGWRKKC